MINPLLPFISYVGCLLVQDDPNALQGTQIHRFVDTITFRSVRSLHGASRSVSNRPPFCLDEVIDRPLSMSAVLNLVLLDEPTCLSSPEGGDVEDSLKAMRKTHEGEEAGKVYDAFRSHAAIARKNRLLLTLLDDIRRANAEVSHQYALPPPPPPVVETPV